MELVILTGINKRIVVDMGTFYYIYIPLTIAEIGAILKATFTAYTEGMAWRIKIMKGE